MIESAKHLERKTLSRQNQLDTIKTKHSLACPAKRENEVHATLFSAETYVQDAPGTESNTDALQRTAGCE
jgi:hypothetical protein